MKSKDQLQAMFERLKPDQNTLCSSTWMSWKFWLGRWYSQYHGLWSLVVFLTAERDKKYNHQGVDIFDKAGSTLVIGCTCSKVFWMKDIPNEADRTGDSKAAGVGHDHH